MTITTIFFDVGGVLYDGHGERRVLETIAQQHSVPYPSVLGVRDKMWRYFRIGALTEREFWGEIFNGINVVGDISEAMAQLHLTPLSKNWAVLPPLRAAGYQLGIISNHAKPWVRRLMAYDNFGAHFDCAVFSCDDDVKSAKPDPAIYQKALAKAGVSASESLFFDDLQKNVDGARAVGMHADLYQWPDDLGEMLRRHDVMF